MFCHKCGAQLTNEDIFCGNCGAKKIEEKNQTSNSETSEAKKEIEVKNSEKNIDGIEYFSIPPKRLALLSILTLGFYEIFWFYKNWEAIKKVEQSKISPLGRAIFTVFYCYDLFKKVLQSAKKYGYGDSYSPGLLATIYIILLLVGNGLSRIEETTLGLDIFWLLIASSAFIPLLSIQKAINYNNSKIVQNYNENREFTSGEITLTVIGIIFFLLVLLGIFAS